jgi:hypothetical protein
MVPEILANKFSPIMSLTQMRGKEPMSWLDRIRERRRKFVAQLDAD